MKDRPCKFCGSPPLIELQKAVCTGCGAHTRSFVNTAKDCQTEDVYAMLAWDRGDYQQNAHNYDKP